jgi:hypothetical protein
VPLNKQKEIENITFNENYFIFLTHQVEYSVIILQDPSVVTSPVYQAVMNLIHALWNGHKELVLNFLRSRSDFWNGFCAPLFQKPRFVIAKLRLKPQFSSLVW